MMRIVFAFAMCLTLAGCAVKGTHGTSSGDALIQAAIVKSWSDAHSGSGAAPNVTVSDGVVSLIGTVASEKDRIDAVRKAWQPHGVVEVVNELQISEAPGKTTRRDRATTIKLRTRLTFDTDAASTHYSIETMDGTVYLMGIAHEEAELAKVKQLAEDMVGKGKVVSYVEIKPLTK